MRFLLSAVCVLAGCGSNAGPSDVDAQVGHIDAGADAKVHTPDAAVSTVCAAKNPVVQLIYTCDFTWQQCTGTMPADHEIDCRIQAAGTLRFSLCDCKVGGVAQMQFTSTTICASASWPDLETIVNTKCGWDLH